MDMRHRIGVGIGITVATLAAATVLTTFGAAEEASSGIVSMTSDAVATTTTTSTTTTDSPVPTPTAEPTQTTTAEAQLTDESVPTPAPTATASVTSAAVSEVDDSATVVDGITVELSANPVKVGEQLIVTLSGIEDATKVTVGIAGAVTTVSHVVDGEATLSFIVPRGFVGEQQLFIQPGTGNELGLISADEFDPTAAGLVDVTVEPVDSVLDVQQVEIPLVNGSSEYSIFS